MPKPTFGRTIQAGADLTDLPAEGAWPKLEVVTSPEENDGAVLVLHPWTCHTFFTAVPASWDPIDVKSRVEEEATLVVGRAGYFVEQEYVRSSILNGERVDHLFVTCIPASITEFTQRLSNRSVQVRTSLSSVASLLTDSLTPAGLCLVLGWYSRHLEINVIVEGKWLFGGYAAYRDPNDCLYYIAALLDRLHLDPLDLDRILQYGSSIESAPDGAISQLFATHPDVLRPSRAFPDARETFLTQPAFVPCAGAVLKQLFAEV